MPRVSVIIPTYQRAHLICESIDSVLAQTYQDLEIIVVDDESTDGTGEVVAKYGERVRYIYQENHGSSSIQDTGSRAARTRNIGCQAARGELIAFLDSDDLWLPEKLTLQVPLFDQDSEVGLVYCDLSYFDADGSIDRPSRFNAHPPLSGNVLREMFVQGCPMHTSTVVIRSQCFDKVGLFDEDLSYYEDQDLWFRLAKMFKVDYVDAPLARWRIHDQVHPYKKIYLWNRAFRKRVLETSPRLHESLSKDELYRGYYWFVYRAALAHLATRETILAREALAECLAFDPFWFKAHVVLGGTYLPSLFLWLQRVLRDNDLISRFQGQYR